MQVINPGDRVFLACTQDWVDGGEQVEVPDADGASLVDQGWKQPKSKAAPAATKTAAAEQED